jgi:hypothetical protein
VAAEIHSIAAVIDRLGDSSHLSVGFEDDRPDIRPPQKFEGRRQSRRSCAGDDGNFLVFIGRSHGD